MKENAEQRRCTHTVGKLGNDDDGFELITIDTITPEVFADWSFEAFSFCPCCAYPVVIDINN